MARLRCSTAPSATTSPISSAGVGSIIFGAAIALVGQMYHLGDDFAGGLLLWAAGALAAAALTGSRSALAVALAAGCVWSGMRVDEMSDVHPQFAIFWLIARRAGADLEDDRRRAIWWRWRRSSGRSSRPSALTQGRIANPTFTFIALVSFMIGAGLLLTTRASAGVRAFGLTLSTYGAFGLAIGLAATVAEFSRPVSDGLPYPILGGRVRRRRCWHSPRPLIGGPRRARARRHLDRPGARSWPRA